MYTFRKCRTKINDTFIDEVEHINMTMSMYNLIEYTDKYSDTSGNLSQFKTDEIEKNFDLTVDAQHIPDNSLPFKNKLRLITNKMM